MEASMRSTRAWAASMRGGVMLGALGEQPALMAVAAAGDAALVLMRAAGGLGGYQAEVGHELTGMLKAVDIAQLADGDHSRDELEAAEGHEGLHGRFEPPAFQELKHGGFDALDAGMGRIDALEVFFEDGLHGGVGQDQFAQITHVGLAPVGFALVTEAVAEEKAFEPVTRAARIIDGIGAGPAQVPDGLVGGLGDIDGGEFPRAQEAGEGAGVAFVGLERGAGLFGNEGRSGDHAGDVQLFEAPGDDKAAGASLVGDFQVGVGMSLTDAVEGNFQSPQVVGDGAEEAQFAVAALLGDGDGDGVLVDIETEIECNSFHGVVVSSYSHDESERISRHGRGRSCGSAHPGNPRIDGRQPHRFFSTQ